MATPKPKGGFLQCLTDKLVKRPNWGKKRLAEAKRAFERVRDDFIDAGMAKADAERLAAEEIIGRVEAARQAKVKAGVKNMEIMDDMRGRLEDALAIRTVYGKSNEADKLWFGLLSMFEQHPDMKGRLDWISEYNLAHGRIWSLARDVMDNFGKGALGTKLGKARMPNVGREMFNANSTGDAPARDIANVFRKAQRMYVSMMNADTAVTLRVVDEEGMPTAFSAVNVSRTAETEFVDDLMQRLDWSRTRWPSGERIATAQREDFLKRMHYAMRTHDYSKFGEKGKVFEQTGGRWAAQWQQERILKFSSYDAWQEMHDKYGDGDIFDVITRSFDKMAYNYSVAKMFGNSPDYMMKQLHQMTKDRANAIPGKAPHLIDKHLRRIDDIQKNVLRHNPMDPESFTAALVATTSNLASTAMLKNAVMVAVPGDGLQTIVTRLANSQSVTSWIIPYINAMFPGNYRKNMVELMNAGFVSDDLISNNFTAARFGAGQQYGPAWSQRVSDVTMRASLMSRHTYAMRAANQKEMMGRLARLRNTSLDQIPERIMFERAGITAAEWDTMRANMPIWSPVQGTEFFRPIDVTDDALAPIAHKVQRMIWNESRRMVLATSLEATARMRLGKRPETAAGALLHSASMYAGYPVTQMIAFTRLLMALDSRVGRTKMIAAMGLGAVFVGALSQQLRNLVQGKEFHKMDTPEFWMKAAVTGGALGIWGDYISGAMRSDTSAQTVLKLTGPLGSIAADAWDLTGGSAFQWAQIGDRTTELSAGAWGREATNFLRENMLPQTWLYAYALERDILEPLQEWMDPVGTRRSQSRRERMAKEQGNPFRRGFEPGEGLFTR